MHLPNKQTNVKPRRPALRYFGGKWRIAPWIISHFPKHTIYCEPFCGSASILLRKERSTHEVLNDKDKEVINFFDILRTRTQEFADAIALTPFSRYELQRSYEPSGDRFEQARRFYLQCWQAYGSNLKRRTGWSTEKSSRNWITRVDLWNRLPEHIAVIADRLKSVRLENNDAIDVIKLWDSKEALFYVDPPYVSSTRSKSWKKEAYKTDIPDTYHAELAEVLHNIKGMAIVSGYESEMYDELFKGWKKFSIQARTTKTTTIKTEVIWLSPRCFKNANQHSLKLIHNS